MNTTGFIRGYMAKNMNAEEFINIVFRALSREFEEETLTFKSTDDQYHITMGNYQVKLDKTFVEKHQSPYGIDRYILDEFKKQGYDLNINRSQYVQYCFGIHHGATEIGRASCRERV